MSIQLTSVEHIQDFCIRVTFNDGAIQDINLEKWVQSIQWHPSNKKYLQIDHFKTCYLDDEGLLCWGENDLVISPAALKYGLYDAEKPKSSAM